MKMDVTHVTLTLLASTTNVLVIATSMVTDKVVLKQILTLPVKILQVLLHAAVTMDFMAMAQAVVRCHLTHRAIMKEIVHVTKDIRVMVQTAQM